MRPRILTDDEVEILKLLVELSRESGIFKLKDLQKGWRIGKMTIYRYDFKEYREKSVEYSRLQRNLDKTCYKCGIPWETHERCPVCTILTHGEECCIGTPVVDNI